MFSLFHSSPSMVRCLVYSTARLSCRRSACSLKTSAKEEMSFSMFLSFAFVCLGRCLRLLVQIHRRALNRATKTDGGSRERESALVSVHGLGCTYTQPGSISSCRSLSARFLGHLPTAPMSGSRRRKRRRAGSLPFSLDRSLPWPPSFVLQDIIHTSRHHGYPSRS